MSVFSYCSREIGGVIYGVGLDGTQISHNVGANNLIILDKNQWNILFGFSDRNDLLLFDLRNKKETVINLPDDLLDPFQGNYKVQMDLFSITYVHMNNAIPVCYCYSFGDGFWKRRYVTPVDDSVSRYDLDRLQLYDNIVLMNEEVEEICIIYKYLYDWVNYSKMPLLYEPPKEGVEQEEGEAEDAVEGGDDDDDDDDAVEGDEDAVEGGGDDDDDAVEGEGEDEDVVEDEGEDEDDGEGSTIEDEIEIEDQLMRKWAFAGRFGVALSYHRLDGLNPELIRVVDLVLYQLSDKKFVDTRTISYEWYSRIPNERSMQGRIVSFNDLSIKDAEEDSLVYISFEADIFSERDGQRFINVYNVETQAWLDEIPFHVLEGTTRQKAVFEEKVESSESTESSGSDDSQGTSALKRKAEETTGETSGTKRQDVGESKGSCESNSGEAKKVNESDDSSVKGRPSDLCEVHRAVFDEQGRVGKSTYTLAGMGARVGIFDTDVYGLSLPTMVSPENRLLEMNPEKKTIIPAEYLGVKMVSFGFAGQGRAVMCGPMVSGVINQLLATTEWGELDYLVIDMPPGSQAAGNVSYLCLMSHPTWHSRTSSLTLVVDVPRPVHHTGAIVKSVNSQFRTKVIVNDDCINIEGEGAPNVVGLFKGKSENSSSMNRYECNLADLRAILLHQVTKCVYTMRSKQVASQIIRWLHEQALTVGMKASRDLLSLSFEVEQGEAVGLVAHVDPEYGEVPLVW